jgi:hypothetical protein
MGTPHVHCTSKLPTAHEPADRVGHPLGDRQRPDEKPVRGESKQM